MNEAHAQTAEVIDAGSKAFGTYADQAGIAAATMGLMVALMAVAVVMMFRRLEQRDRDITELKVTCAKEIAQAKLDAAAEADERVELAWKRHDQIYQSVNVLFAKYDTTMATVSTSLQKLQLVLASKGVIAND